MKTQKYLLTTGLALTAYLFAGYSFGQADLKTAQNLLNTPITIQPQNGDIASKDSIQIPTDTIASISLEANLDNAVREVKLSTTSKARGAKEIAVYDQIASGTVLIVAGDGLGSGALITENGYIITNQHVVGKNKEVAVFFKPVGNAINLDKKNAVRGTVVKVNEFKDLALVKVDAVPPSARPIALNNGSPRVGEDAHAIGHPKGQYWTYTRGYVSAIRDNYKWSAGKDTVGHEAKVIQTQTPINPGNSGGPLVDDDRKLIGINSFIAPDSPGLNFAVSADDVKQFIAQEGSKTAPPKTAQKNCGDNIFGKGKDSDSDGPYEFIAYDTQCSGKVDAVLRLPNDKSKPIIFLFDSNRDGKWDIFVFDKNRDGKWDISYHDTNFDGKVDLVGRHPDGKIVPSSFDKMN